jgi:hypothetical protein
MNANGSQRDTPARQLRVLWLAGEEEQPEAVEIGVLSRGQLTALPALRDRRRCEQRDHLRARLAPPEPQLIANSTPNGTEHQYDQTAS